MQLADRIRAIVKLLPENDSVSLSVATLAIWLNDEAPPLEPGPPVLSPGCWRERLWTAPAETRLGLDEVAEAVGQNRNFVYRRTGPRSQYCRIPHRKLDGTLVFTVGEVRDWLQRAEERVVDIETAGFPARARMR